jgi:ABC-2 type transport system permease protein
MMRVLEIARKDLFHSLRSMFLVVFAFGLPLITTGVFYAAFGGFQSGSNQSPAAPAKVALANLESSGSIGQTLQDVLTGPGMNGVIDTTVVPAAADARAVVDAGQASAAVIIPADFSRRLMDPAQTATLELYRDPTQTVGPAVVQAIVEQTLDGFSGARIAAVASMRMFTERGIPPSADQAAGIAGAYGEWLAGSAQDPSGSGWWLLRAPSQPSGADENRFAGMISTIMAMMLVFYCFFTGASAAQSILQEQEDGTLPRLFTTPASRTVILGGKMLAVLFMLLLQVTVLVLISTLVFNIRWGTMPGILAAVAGTSCLSAGFGIFLISFLKSTKQAGLVFGVFVNLTGWVGIIRLFMGIFPSMENISGATNFISLLVPQGWAARLWQEAMSGSPMWISLAVTLGVSAALFWIGVRKLQRRFAV